MNNSNMLFAASEKGQSLVEWMVILGILAVVAVIVLKAFDFASANVCGTIEQALGECKG